MSDVTVTVVGHVGQDPALYTAPSGTRWTSIRVASTRRVRDPLSGEWGDGPTLWFTVRAFGDRALNLVESVRKGTPVVVTGRLAFEEFEGRRQERGPDGTTHEVKFPRYALVVENASIGVDLARGSVRYMRTVHTAALPQTIPGAPPDVVGAMRDGDAALEAEEPDALADDVAHDVETVEAGARETAGA
ncbi:single-stranded DNA-binding protein [Xylanimonas ulmi]|uniref:Single-stranded DNA-binding protein n=1 Tax=Xylanimonas ulmi TaxID=228973 RepID=A0A4Q7M127_9MICO|nr:single-stranded DNA-binding protein [Xylanibacterium ulmi]RZS61495.1 single-strand DNA-binding protein [Xylanibacterium ulmi]